MNFLVHVVFTLFEIKQRSECITNTSKYTKVKTERVDILFVSNRTMEDVFLYEDKKACASYTEITSVEKKKNLRQRLLTILSWTKRFGPEYVNHLEVITGLWHGVHLGSSPRKLF